MLPVELPEWKRQVLGGAKASFGRKETKSLLEQRQGLPIYKLKDELLKVIVMRSVSAVQFYVCSYLLICLVVYFV